MTSIEGEDIGNTKTGDTVNSGGKDMGKLEDERYNCILVIDENINLL